jgi:hypothetical protein
VNRSLQKEPTPCAPAHTPPHSSNAVEKPVPFGVNVKEKDRPSLALSSDLHDSSVEPAPIRPQGMYWQKTGRPEDAYDWPI